MSKFPRTARLVTQSDFRSVFAKPNKISCRSILVLFCSNELNVPRLGISLRKQLQKRAVDRNCIKRIVRESFRSNQHKLLGLDMVFLLKAKNAAANKMMLRQEVDSLWERLANFSKS